MLISLSELSVLCTCTWLPGCHIWITGARLFFAGTTVRRLKDDSHFLWMLREDFFSSRVTQDQLDIQLMFRTRDPDGVLFTVAGADNSQSVSLEVSKNGVCSHDCRCHTGSK